MIEHNDITIYISIILQKSKTIKIQEILRKLILVQTIK
jgi:predicted DNA-binding transcriptional regulator